MEPGIMIDILHSIVPVLLAVIGSLLGVIAWNLRSTLQRNEKDHDLLFDTMREHGQTLVEHDVRIRDLEATNTDNLGHSRNRR